MKTSDIGDHFTPLDRSVLEGENAYADYFTYLKFALEQLIESLGNYQGTEPFERVIIKGLSQKFLNTIDALSLKYAFQEEQPMLVDLTESGFPNHLEFRRLNDDLDKRKATLKTGQSVRTLKKLILDHLIKSKAQPLPLLQQLARQSYFEKIRHDRLFTEYTAGDIDPIAKAQGDTQKFLYSWGSFDSVTNRPYIYILVFEHQETGKNWRKDDLGLNFKDQIRKITHDTAPLKVMISDIDAMNEYIMPKVLKRIAIGPIFGRYAQDEHAFTKLIKTKFNHDDFIFRYDAEVIFSIGEKRNKSFLSQGELRQIFFINESNKESMEKMTSDLLKYTITSHSVWQYLSEYHPEMLSELAVQPHIYS